MNRPTWQQIQEFSSGLPSFGKKLRLAREEKRMTILNVAKQANVEPQFWSNLEHDRVWPPKELRQFIAELLSTTPALLDQDLSRHDHELKKYLDKHEEVVDWLRRMSKDEPERSLILRS